jgi:hypothetical protein
MFVRHPRAITAIAEPPLLRRPRSRYHLQGREIYAAASAQAYNVAYDPRYNPQIAHQDCPS